MKDELFHYYAAFAKTVQGYTLSNPSLPILGCNATYADYSADPTLEQFKVGFWQRSELSPLVEQVSWLQAAALAEVLSNTWNLPEWQDSIAVQLSYALQKNKHIYGFIYYEPMARGCILLLEGGAHIWGAAHPTILKTLLCHMRAWQSRDIATSVPLDIDIELQNPKIARYTESEEIWIHNIHAQQ